MWWLPICVCVTSGELTYDAMMPATRWAHTHSESTSAPVQTRSPTRAVRSCTNGGKRGVHAANGEEWTRRNVRFLAVRRRVASPTPTVLRRRRKRRQTSRRQVSQRRRRRCQALHQRRRRPHSRASPRVSAQGPCRPRSHRRAPRRTATPPHRRRHTPFSRRGRYRLRWPTLCHRR